MDIQTIRQVKERIESEWLKRPGVTGIDIGNKIINGKKTDTLAIRILVKEKKDVPPEWAIPPDIEGIPTDVIQRSFRLH